MAVVPGDRCDTMADRSGTTGGAFATARVLPEDRRRGVGTAILHELADHCEGLGLPERRASVGDEQQPSPLPPGVDVVELCQRPELWADSYDTFGGEVLADFAVFEPLDISTTQWNTSWAGDPMSLALYDGEVIGCAGLHRDTDRLDGVRTH